jgi:hypothetical protein
MPRKAVFLIAVPQFFRLPCFQAALWPRKTFAKQHTAAKVKPRGKMLTKLKKTLTLRPKHQVESANCFPAINAYRNA